MSDTLKSCPFCGGPAVQVDAGAVRRYVACDDDGCSARSAHYSQMHIAVEAWNRRASLSPETASGPTRLLPVGNCPTCDAIQGHLTAWGGSPEMFRRCRVDHDAGHLETSLLFGVRATPTMLIDGRSVGAAPSIEDSNGVGTTPKSGPPADLAEFDAALDVYVAKVRAAEAMVFSATSSSQVSTAQTERGTARAALRAWVTRSLQDAERWRFVRSRCHVGLVVQPIEEGSDTWVDLGAILVQADDMPDGDSAPDWLNRLANVGADTPEEIDAIVDAARSLNAVQDAP